VFASRNSQRVQLVIEGVAEKAAKRDIRPQGGEVVIHGPDGRIRDKDTMPPAKDPNPPKDTKH
jgi:hypothetical protein